jgi:hypothetical protein
MPPRLDCLSSGDLQRLDEARDEDSASSRNYLEVYLSRLYVMVKQGTPIHVFDDASVFVLSNVADFKNWCYARYPGAAYLEWRAS